MQQNLRRRKRSRFRRHVASRLRVCSGQFCSLLAHRFSRWRMHRGSVIIRHTSGLARPWRGSEGVLRDSGCAPLVPVVKNQAGDLRVVARLCDHQPTIRVTNEDHEAALRGGRPLGDRHIICQRNDRILNDCGGVPVLLEDFIDALSPSSTPVCSRQ